MALMVESEAGPAYASMHAYGFDDPAAAAAEALGHRPPPRRRPHGGARRPHRGRAGSRPRRLSSGATPASTTSCRASRQTGATAVLALGRKHSNEPLSSEDMALLAAVAGQMATALENARLYRQLHVKAHELDRLRAFNENILESLDDGLLVVDLDDKVVRWNTALENALRRVAQRRRGPGARRPASTARASRRCGRRAAIRPPAPCSRACRCTAAAPRSGGRSSSTARSSPCGPPSPTMAPPKARWSSSRT